MLEGTFYSASTDQRIVSTRIEIRQVTKTKRLVSVYD